VSPSDVISASVFQFVVLTLGTTVGAPNFDATLARVAFQIWNVLRSPAGRSLPKNTVSPSVVRCPTPLFEPGSSNSATATSVPNGLDGLHAGAGPSGPASASGLESGALLSGASLTSTTPASDGAMSSSEVTSEQPTSRESGARRARRTRHPYHQLPRAASRRWK